MGDIFAVIGEDDVECEKMVLGVWVHVLITWRFHRFGGNQNLHHRRPTTIVACCDCTITPGLPCLPDAPERVVCLFNGSELYLILAFLDDHHE